MSGYLSDYPASSSGNTSFMTSGPERVPLERAGSTLTATADIGQWSVPCSGPVRVVVGGPVVEIVGTFGALAFPAPRGACATLVSRDADGTAYPLG